LVFKVVIALFILQRLTELFISKKNEKWLLVKGAVEYGQSHYPYMIALHAGFVLAVVCEYYLSPGKVISFSFLILFIVILITKIMVINSLGKYWNTKIYRIPNFKPVKTGAYKFIRHPNYILVVCEIITFPLIFHLYYTAIIFTLLNAIMLSVRIKAENQVWSSN